MTYSLTETPRCVYGIFDVDDPDRIRYVGLTTKGIKQRFAGHWSQAHSTDRKLPIMFWMRKRTREQIGIRVLEVADDLEHLKLLEIFHIAQYRDLGMADLNLTAGGEAMTGRVMPPEEKAWRSERFSGSGNPMYGVKRPPGFMDWVKSHQKPMSEENRELRRQNMGHLNTNEAREKAVSGIKKSHNRPEYKVKARERVLGESNPMYGRRYTEEEKRAQTLLQSKYTEQDIRDIRSRRAAGETAIELGEAFGCTANHIQSIVAGRKWGWVE